MPEAAPPVLKPAILIGHGRFGRAVLRRLLRKTATRGSLAWATPAATGTDSHRLRDLALLWLPEAQERTPTTDGDPIEPDATDGNADFLLDLYRQIRTVPPHPGATEPALAAAAAEAAAFLRRPEVVALRPGDQPGLDLIVLAHLEAAPAVATLDSLTRAVLRRLEQDNPGWRVAQTANRRLHCIAVLDFDNYRGSGPEAAALRRALGRSLEAWRAALTGKQPAVGRCYLLDGRAGDSHRPSSSRVGEVTLWLELLLFAGLRGDDRLKSLYEHPGGDQGIAAAFGVRLLERSTGWLSQLAAARFGAGWLPYLRGGGETGCLHPPQRLAAALAPLLAEVQAGAASHAPLDARWRQATDALAAELAALPAPAAADWVTRVSAGFERGARQLARELQRDGLACIRRLREAHLADHGKPLIAAIGADLHDQYHPVPLQAVTDTLDETITALQGQAAPAATGPAAPPRPTAVAHAHAAFRAAEAQWIRGNGRGLAGFWPLFALIGALLATPIAQDLVRQLPLIAAADSPWQARLLAASTVLDRPLTLAPALFVLLWSSLALGPQRAVRRGIARARAFFLDPTRGQLAAALRVDCDQLAGLREQTRDNVRAALAVDTLAVLTRLRARLAARAAELDWLSAQLREFQRMQGLVDPTDLIVHPPADACHRLVLAPDDLQRMMQIRPAVAAHFEAHQPDLPAPFAGWDAPYCAGLLDLFGFVGALSGRYRQAFDDAASGAPGSAGTGPEWQLRRAALADLLARSAPAPGFRISADQRTSTAVRFAVLPSAWQRDDGVRELLSRHGFDSEAWRLGSDPARLYLLTVEWHLDATALEGAT
ncbi:MAG: hypothetical protein EA400_03720 [Chromatiaceae bacterium]|nr:MAG: hypothetical protein EA400_03720 [Chromatiaceae bacterium]